MIFGFLSLSSTKRIEALIVQKCLILKSWCAPVEKAMAEELVKVNIRLKKCGESGPNLMSHFFLIYRFRTFHFDWIRTNKSNRQAPYFFKILFSVCFSLLPIVQELDDQFCIVTASGISEDSVSILLVFLFFFFFFF